MWKICRPSFKKLLPRVALIALGLAIGLLSVEIGLRLLNIGFPLPYMPDEHVGVRHQPGFRGWWTKEGRGWIEINQHGFRHGAVEPEKPPGTFRVAVLGDSFIEAFQVDAAETVCSAIERELQGCDHLADRDVQALGFGVSGYGTAQSLLMLRHYVWDYEPDVVVLAFFPGNDVRNNSRDLEPDAARPFFVLRDGRLELDESFRQHPQYLKARQPSTRCKVAAINRLRLLQLINQWRHRPAAAKAAVGERGGLIEPADERWRSAWELTERLIVEIQREVRANGAQFLLAIVSSDVQVHPEAAVRSADGDLFYAERRLQSLGEQYDFPVVALAAPMRQHAAETATYLHGFANTRLGDGHWNAAGHALAGKIIAEAICEQWVPPDNAR